jgi:hypothetical protein
MSDSAYQTAAALLVRQLSSIAFNVLTKRRLFDKYERILGLESPHDAFRHRLAWELARYLQGARVEAMSDTQEELEEKAKASRHTLKILRNRLNRAHRPLEGNPEYQKAFTAAVFDRHELNNNKAPRSRPRNKFSAVFIERIADIFRSFTGEEPVIVNNRNQDNGGLFGEFLKELTRDSLCLARALEWDRSRLSANLARHARHRRPKK